jgi:hypothetical protein
MIQGEFQRMHAHKEHKSYNAVTITEILTFIPSGCWRMTSGDTLRFHVLSDGAVPVVLRPYHNYGRHHINMAGARRGTQRYSETSLCFPPFVSFKDGQLTWGNPSVLSTFRPIQRRPTYTGKPVPFAHLSFRSKSPNVHRWPNYGDHWTMRTLNCTLPLVLM